MFQVAIPLSLLVRILMGALLAGFGLSLIGVFVVHLKVTSVGFCMSHAAFAGAFDGEIQLD